MSLSHKIKDALCVPTASLRISKRPKPSEATVARMANTAINKDAMKSKKNWCDQMLENRDITPRTRAFLAHLRKTIEKALRTKSDKAVEEVQVLEEFVESRSEKVEAIRSLKAVLSETYQELASTRLLTEYGDYLACNLAIAKADNTVRNQMAWNEKSAQTDWMYVADRLEEEEVEIAGWVARSCSGAQPARPMGYNITCAADHLGIPVKQLRYEVLTYGRRNRLCHNQVKRMAELGDWPKLARRILHDLDTLPVVMSFDNESEPLMRAAVERFRDRYFTAVQWGGEEEERQDVVDFALTEEMTERNLRRIRRDKARSEQAQRKEC